MTSESNLKQLGDKISRLRIARSLKQSELAYEAGISERTLQRMEAGEVVKTDGLLKVIAYLGRLDDTLKALDTPALSPYELAKNPGKPAGSSSRRARVRRSKPGAATSGDTPAKITWPEDQT